MTKKVVRYDEEEEEGSSRHGVAFDDSARSTSYSEKERLLTESGVQRVKAIRALVTVMLIVASVGLGLTIALVTMAWEEKSFQDDFAHDAQNLFQHVGIRTRQSLDAMASFSTLITSTVSSSSSSSSKWPFVTIPDFDVHAAHVLDALQTSGIVFCPIVRQAEREAWEHHVYNQTTILPLPLVQQESSQSTTPIFALQEDEDNHDLKTTIRRSDAPYYLPVWQSSPTTPVLKMDALNFDLTSLPTAAQAIQQVHFSGDKAGAVLSAPLAAVEMKILQKINLFSVVDGKESVRLWITPIFESTKTTETTAVGYLVAPFFWTSVLNHAFASGTQGVEAILKSSCDNVASTYVVNDHQAIFKGNGDLHTKYYNHLVESSALSMILQESGYDLHPTDMKFLDSHCPFTVDLCPSPVYMNQHTPNHAIKTTVFVVVVLDFIFLLTLIYGGFFQRTFETKSAQAIHTQNLVNALFPKEVQERMFKTAGGAERAALAARAQAANNDPFTKAKAFLAEQNKNNQDDDIPIADLWPDCTVMFADIKGFTAWSACRSPTEVFQLLESLYKEFDRLAKRRGVFKVETIGDCYVAVMGLPNPCKDHAAVMCRFAYECQESMKKLTRQLELTLGPDTGDLSLRIGVHSGPVTAGVLRGDKGRFQLFGDTVNTASRMESNGIPGKIQASEATAKLLIAAGKEHWVSPREVLIEAKGKGCMQTFFVNPKSGSMNSSSQSPSSVSGESETGKNDGPDALDAKSMRLVDWNVEMLSRFLKKIINRRGTVNIKDDFLPDNDGDETNKEMGNVIDEFKPVVDLLEYKYVPDSMEKDLDPEVSRQLKEYVTVICSMYRNRNHFHNFEHASHVAMSVVKLIQRVVAPGSNDDRTDGNSDQSYGLANDPLTQFTCVFSALIHDVDHPGCPNSVLIAERSPIARAYKNKSIAEQNSVDLAWDLLQQPIFEDLRNAICATRREKKHFRQVVVNAVMATDIMDKEWKTMRENRWTQAFENDDLSRENMNRKATIVIEHMLQASDIAHTMQHWHIYRKWNENFFRECYDSYKMGRVEIDPSLNWYAGELGFFDFYIIPLAKKLSDCGVFGVSSAEYLSFAQSNREEWKHRGQAIVQEMVEKARGYYHHKSVQN